MKLYHYSSTKIENIDMNKCDGFWMTTIAPTETELLMEIGADGFEFCHIIDFDDSGEVLMNGSNEEVAEQLESEEADYIKNNYDGFTDYATCNADLIKITNIIEL